MREVGREGWGGGEEEGLRTVFFVGRLFAGVEFAAFVAVVGRQ